MRELITNFPFAFLEQLCGHLSFSEQTGVVEYGRLIQRGVGTKYISNNNVTKRYTA